MRRRRNIRGRLAHRMHLLLQVAPRDAGETFREAPVQQDRASTQPPELLDLGLRLRTQLPLARPLFRHLGAKPALLLGPLASPVLLMS